MWTVIELAEVGVHWKAVVERIMEDFNKKY
jgi:hypothetical protein